MTGLMRCGPQTTLLSSCSDVWCWYFCCWPAIDRRTTTSLGCLRQAAPHDIPFGLLFWLFELMPQAFSSVKISVKKPGSAFIRSILPLKRFTIRRHLKKEWGMVLLDIIILHFPINHYGKMIDVCYKKESKKRVDWFQTYLSQNLSLESSTKNGFSG